MLWARGGSVNVEGVAGCGAADDRENGVEVAWYGDAAVACDGAERLGEEEQDAYETHCDHDDDAPEDGAPAKALRQRTAHGRRNARREHRTQVEHAKVAATLARRGDVAYDAGAQGDGAGAAAGLEAAQEQEQPVGVGGTQGHADAGGDEDAEAHEVDEAAAVAVADGAPEHGRDALEDEVDGDGLVDVVD